jgi:hypothetical protein
MAKAKANLVSSKKKARPGPKSKHGPSTPDHKAKFDQLLGDAVLGVKPKQAD